MSNSFSADSVPSSARGLVTLAARWGITDDYRRCEALQGATRSELEELVDRVDNAGSDFYDWLEGDESYSDIPSEGYVVMSALALAADYANVLLKQTS